MNSAMLLCAIQFVFVSSLNLEYLDPECLQTTTTAETQQRAAARIINKYDKTNNVRVHVDISLFQDSKDVFVLYTEAQKLNINASSGIAAVWGYNYFLKKYCNGHIGWGMQRIDIKQLKLPNINEKVIATVRFRYFGNPEAFSYSYVWWDEEKWMQHVDWMALNGINVALAPVAQEAAWSRVYRKLGMTQDEIDQYFTGPAYLAFNRRGMLRRWGGPLPETWHRRQTEIQKAISTYMLDLGIVPVFPTFNGHVPREFKKLFSQTLFRIERSWWGFDDYYCCDLFVDPVDPLFKEVGKMFLNEMITDSPVTRLYYVEMLYTIPRIPKYTGAVTDFTNITQSIFSTLTNFDDRTVLVVLNTREDWILSQDEARSLLTAIPEGRMLVLDMMSDENLHYGDHGQPSVFNMLRTIDSRLEMSGDAEKINEAVYTARNEINTTMIGLGVMPSVMEHNYMLVELVLEAAWRNTSPSLPDWLQQYAARRYGCYATAGAWVQLLNSVYSGYSKARDFILRWPSRISDPLSWYRSRELFQAWRKFAFVPDDECRSAGFEYDLIDVTRQALHYRAQQLHWKLRDRWGYMNNILFRNISNEFIDLLENIGYLLSSNEDFTLYKWLSAAKNMSSNPEEAFLYDNNARSIVTLLIPFSDEYEVCKPRPLAELYSDYYVPNWSKFLELGGVRETLFTIIVERDYFAKNMERPIKIDTRKFVLELYKKWGFMPNLQDLQVY